MSLYALKPQFQRLLNPITVGLRRVGVTPNMVTLSAVALSATAAAGVAFANGFGYRAAFLVIPAVQLVRMALNAVDGAMARRFSLQSKAGALLNETTDIVNDALLLVPFLLVPELSAPALISLLFLTLLAEFVGVTTWAVCGDRRYDGPLGKADRALLTSGLAAAVGFGVPLAYWSETLLWAACGLAALTITERARHGLAGSEGVAS